MYYGNLNPSLRLHISPWEMVSFDTKVSPLHIIPHPICPVSILLINAQGWDSAFTFIFHERKIGRKGGRKKRGLCTDHSACSDDCRTPGAALPPSGCFSDLLADGHLKSYRKRNHLKFNELTWRIFSSFWSIPLSPLHQH